MLTSLEYESLLGIGNVRNLKTLINSERKRIKDRGTSEKKIKENRRQNDWSLSEKGKQLGFEA